MRITPENNYKNKYVTILYTFKNSNGDILGNSDTSGPYVFCIGTGDAIIGLEENIQEMKEGESKEFVIPSYKAYGEYKQDLVKEIPKSSLPQKFIPEKGNTITINKNIKAIITEVQENSITVDANHPLAGLDLYFSITLQSISAYPPEESNETCGCGHSCQCGNSHDKSKH